MCLAINKCDSLSLSSQFSNDAEGSNDGDADLDDEFVFQSNERKPSTSKWRSRSAGQPLELREYYYDPSTPKQKRNQRRQEQRAAKRQLKKEFVLAPLEGPGTAEIASPKGGCARRPRRTSPDNKNGVKDMVDFNNVDSVSHPIVGDNNNDRHHIKDEHFMDDQQQPFYRATSPPRTSTDSFGGGQTEYAQHQGGNHSIYGGSPPSLHPQQQSPPGMRGMSPRLRYAHQQQPVLPFSGMYQQTPYDRHNHDGVMIDAGSMAAMAAASAPQMVHDRHMNGFVGVAPGWTPRMSVMPFMTPFQVTAGGATTGSSPTTLSPKMGSPLHMAPEGSGANMNTAIPFGCSLAPLSLTLLPHGGYAQSGGGLRSRIGSSLSRLSSPSMTRSRTESEDSNKLVASNSSHRAEGATDVTVRSPFRAARRVVPY